MNIYRKRGYVKWTDEDGVKHKVREEEYEAVEKLTEKNPERDQEESDELLHESEDNGFV